MDERKWYVVYTRPRWEKKVAELLSKKQLSNYCPLNKVAKQWRDRKKLIEEPLFKSYVFVRVALKEFNSVLETSGVVRFVSWLNKPAVIREQEIQAIREFLNAHHNVKVEPYLPCINDSVRIVEGPLSDREGRILALSQSRVWVYLPSMKYIMSVEIDRKHIQLLNSPGRAPANSIGSPITG